MKVTPLTIPNRKVKLHSANGTAGEALWESRSLPGKQNTHCIEFILYNGYLSIYSKVNKQFMDYLKSYQVCLIFLSSIPSSVYCHVTLISIVIVISKIPLK